MTGVAAVVGVIGIAALVQQGTDFAKELANLPSTLNGVVTQTVGWVIGEIVVWLYAASQWGSSVVVGGIGLDKMNTASKIITGLMAGSTGSAFFDYLKARDNRQTSAKPALLARWRRDASPGNLGPSDGPSYVVTVGTSAPGVVVYGPPPTRPVPDLRPPGAKDS